MKFDVRLRPEAENELREAAEWYNRQRAALGRRFLDEVDAALEAIAERPEAYPVVYLGLRRALLHRFPFAIFYRVTEGLVLVIGVMHASRDPHHWMIRAVRGVADHKGTRDRSD